MTRAYFDAEHPVRLAHRGSTVLWPENTFTAFDGAVDLGYRYLELDVRVTADGHLVAFHDATLERTTNGSGRVAEWSWQDLARLDAGYRHDPEGGHPFRDRGICIPLLDEVFERYRDARLNLDLKAPGIEEAVFSAIERHDRRDTVLIGSFFDRRLMRFRRVSGGRVATSAGPAEVTRMWLASRVGRSGRIGADALQIPPAAAGMRLDGRLIGAAHDSGLQVHVWTINDPIEMDHLLDLGVDGIVTDRPDLLNGVLEERGLRPPAEGDV